MDICIDAFNWKNEWTNHTIQEEDIGAGRNHQYTSRYNRGNEWYSKWLPDQTRNDQGRGINIEFYFVHSYILLLSVFL